MKFKHHKYSDRRTAPCFVGIVLGRKPERYPLLGTRYAGARILRLQAGRHQFELTWGQPLEAIALPGGGVGFRRARRRDRGLRGPSALFGWLDEPYMDEGWRPAGKKERP